MKPYTPLFDDIVQEYKSIITAAVFGYVWRQCQRERGVCDASNETIGKSIGVTARTVVTHLQLLVDDGKIEDLTPGIRNRPHKYSVKELHSRYEINSYQYERDSQQSEINSHLGMKQFPNGYERDSHEDTNKETIEDTDNNSGAAAFKAYEKEIGVLTPLIADDIGDMVDEVGEDWVIDAIGIASRANVRKWAYIQKILERWRVDGKQDMRKPTPNGHSNGINQPAVIQPATDDESAEFERLIANATK